MTILSAAHAQSSCPTNATHRCFTLWSYLKNRSFTGTSGCRSGAEQIARGVHNYPTGRVSPIRTARKVIQVGIDPVAVGWREFEDTAVAVSSLAKSRAVQVPSSVLQQRVRWATRALYPETRQVENEIVVPVGTAGRQFKDGASIQVASTACGRSNEISRGVEDKPTIGPEPVRLVLELIESSLDPACVRRRQCVHGSPIEARKSCLSRRSVQVPGMVNDYARIG